jgi:hypothetical protein
MHITRGGECTSRILKRVLVNAQRTVGRRHAHCASPYSAGARRRCSRLHACRAIDMIRCCGTVSLSWAEPPSRCLHEFGSVRELARSLLDRRNRHQHLLHVGSIDAGSPAHYRAEQMHGGRNLFEVPQRMHTGQPRPDNVGPVGRSRARQRQ